MAHINENLINIQFTLNFVDDRPTFLYPSLFIQAVRQLVKYLHMEDVKEYSDSTQFTGNKIAPPNTSTSRMAIWVRLPAYFIVALYRSHESPTILEGAAGRSDGH